MKLLFPNLLCLFSLSLLFNLLLLHFLLTSSLLFFFNLKLFFLESELFLLMLKLLLLSINSQLFLFLFDFGLIHNKLTPFKFFLFHINPLCFNYFILMLLLKHLKFHYSFIIDFFQFIFVIKVDLFLNFHKFLLWLKYWTWNLCNFW